MTAEYLLVFKSISMKFRLKGIVWKVDEWLSEFCYLIDNGVVNAFANLNWQEVYSTSVKADAAENV